MFALLAALVLGQAASATATPAARPVAAPPSVAQHPKGGQDFTAEAKLLFRVVACAGDAAIPPELDAKVIEAHCADLKRRTDKYQKTWVEVAEPFIQKLKPAGLPTTVVYPFGGGDLISALTTYPEATEITTMSLEYAGDPRRIHNKLDAKTLKTSLELIRRITSGLLVANDSKTENLQKGQRGELPGQLSFFLIGLAVHGYEPISMRYVKANSDGTLHGITAEEIAALESKNAALLRKEWVSPDFSEAFSNVELTFARKGEDLSHARVHRHFAEDLSDDAFGKDTALRAHLEAKGRICAMTKAASYLLWRDQFSTIRDYLLKHMEFMVSDSTGIPPRFATAAGFTQVAYGRFSESFLGANAEYNEDFRKLWKKPEALPFRYGYVDKKLQSHMLITRKKDAEAPKP